MQLSTTDAKEYEFTGEFRYPKACEEFFQPTDKIIARAAFDFVEERMPIVRKKGIAPSATCILHKEENAEKPKKSFMRGSVIMDKLTSKKDTDRIGYLYDLVKYNKISKLQFIQALGVVALLEDTV